MYECAGVEINREGLFEGLFLLIVEEGLIEDLGRFDRDER